MDDVATIAIFLREFIKRGMSMDPVVICRSLTAVTSSKRLNNTVRHADSKGYRTALY